MPRPISVRIKQSAILHNYRIVKKLAPQARAWAVVKANAYGHGLLNAASALAADADGFALLDIADALALRAAGIRQPILLLEGFFSASDLDAIVAHDLSLVVHRIEQLEMIIGNPRAHAVPLAIKLNSGMNRLGFTDAELPALFNALERLQPTWLTLMTHFADADGARGVAWQKERFDTMRQRFAARWSGEISLANSAAIMRHPATHADWVRPGIILYGGSPFAELSAASFGLQPAMTIASQIIAVQNLRPGESVGYGSTFTTAAPRRIGIVACGYADGYPRHAPSGTPILVGGRRTQTVGRVSMDMLAVDLAELPDAGVGTPVVLWGEGLPAEEVASAAGTISYELFCALAARVPAISC